MKNRIGSANHHEPKVQTRPVIQDCHIEVQQDENFCATCGCRWFIKDTSFVCPNKKGE